MVQRMWRGLAVAFTALLLGAIVFALNVRGEKRIDFDVTGFLFLLTNLPMLCAWALVFMFGGMAIHSWVRYFQTQDE